MANGTLKVGTITTSSGSGTITLGQSGETIALGSGVTNNSSTPILFVKKVDDQSLTDATLTKITFTNTNSSIIDTDNAFSTSDSKFTVPSDKAGKYLITYGFQSFNSSNDIYSTYIMVYINGSNYQGSLGQTTDNGTTARNMFIQGVRTATLTAGDEIEFYAYVDVNSGTAVSSGDTYVNIMRIG